MKEKEIAYEEYKKYKTQWLIDNGYTLDDVIDYLHDLYKYQKEDPYLLFKNFEKYGFENPENSKFYIYPCFDEWYNSQLRQD